ncbi:MAG: YqgE/AlgH family protein [Chitinispirillaceae bacterium]|nr:YqgE/AlgH family protein [Chitinispirillaceae bacterium]
MEQTPCDNLFYLKMEAARPEKTLDPGLQKRLERLGNGAVLMAHDALQDPNFTASVVLICIYAREGGAYGLVLNRPSHMPLSEIFDGVSGMDARREIGIGGPVAQDELQVLQITNEPQPESFQVAPRVYLGGKWQSVEQMLALESRTARLFLGYSGWAPGQLEHEIEAGAWEVYRVDVETLLLNAEKTLSPKTNSIASFLGSITLR